MKKTILFPLLLLSGSFCAMAQTGTIVPTENLIAENIPAIPKTLAETVRKYSEARGASLLDVHPLTHEIIISTRFAATAQLHLVRNAAGARKQLTFFDEPVGDASFEPKRGDYLVYSKDIGGNEFRQLFKMDLKTMQSTLLTDGGRSQNGSPVWRNDGDGFYFTSTKRNGGDRDVYFTNPSEPGSTRMVREFKGGGWSIADISADDRKLLIGEYVSANESHLWLLDLVSGTLTQITDRKKSSKVVQTDALFSGESNRIWLCTDRDFEFRRLTTLDLSNGKMAYHTTAIPWDIDNFELTEDKKTLAFVANQAGVDQLYLMDAAAKTYKPVNLPIGLIGGLQFSKDGQFLYFTQSTAKSASDVYRLDLPTGVVERWTESELGGIQESDISLPKAIQWKSFDGLQISGFYYPASARFTGKRPVMITIHGGPEGQSNASFLGSSNYYTNEMGVAVIAPNVRGSSGFGKTYLAKDNGFLREDSVKDIGALLDWIAAQPELDKDRIMIMGGSYGGYMTLATAFHYADRIRCSVDIVGISHFTTFLKNTEEYRRDLRRVEYGDERDPKMAAFFEKIAPLNNIGRIKKPLFIIQGTNDPRVPVTEATQMRDKLKAQGNVVWYLEAKDEGHGFRKKPNVDYQRLAVIRFMEEYLLN